MRRKAAKKQIYQHMEKVIVTLDNLARIAYVAADHKGNTGFVLENRTKVRIAFHLEDAQQHAYKIISGDYVMPFNQEIWDAFERLKQKEIDLKIWFDELRNGRIPDQLQPVVQGDLFSLQNTRPIGRE